MSAGNARATKRGAFATNMTNADANSAPFALPAPVELPIEGAEPGVRAPVGRIFCVGRNYAAHAAEMGAAAEPVFFMKPAQAVVVEPHAPYPVDTERLDHEVELAVMLGRAGAPRSEDEARDMIFGYAAAIDLTRRDAQAAAKAAGAPWETAKAFDGSAPVSPLRTAAAIGHPRAGAIWLTLDGAQRQSGDLAQMILSPEALLVRLARYWRLAPGDLILTGTPAGVGPIERGQVIEAGIDGVGALSIRID